MSRVSRRGAFTLFEVIVVLGLIALVGAIGYQTFQIMFQRTPQVMESTSTAEAGFVVLYRLEQELQRTRPEALTLSDAPDALALTRVESVNSSGKLLWEPALQVYYWDAESEQIRTFEWRDEVPGTGQTPTADQPVQLEPAQLRDLLSQPEVQSRPVTGQVDLFEIVPGEGGQTLTVSLRVTKPEPTLFERTLMMRNAQ